MMSKARKVFVIICEETINRHKKKYSLLDWEIITITINAVLHSCSNSCFVGLTYFCLGCDRKPSRWLRW